MILEKFWELCEKYFGYQSENSNVDDLAACMLLTYASVALKDTLPAVLKSYILKKKNDVVVFVRNLMDNVLYQDAYDALSEKVDKTLRVVSRIRDELKKDAGKAKDQSAQLLDIANCDAFRELDNILIDWALDQLNDEILDAQIDGMNLAQIAEQRTAKSCHFGNVYKNEYQAIKYAYQIMKAVSILEVTSDIKAMVADYQKQTYLIDSYYRWFYSAYDSMEDAERFSQLRERIENMYSFTYLQKVTPKWNQELTENLMADTGLKRQEDFYRNYLKAYEGKNRVIVIISDAFRYECAKELMERLELDEKCTPKLECMISGLPSVTSVGMASLFEEHYVSVPEQGGGKLIPEGMGKPGSVYTVSKSKTGMIGCYMLETQMMPGNGKLTCTGIGSGKEPKEATNTAFNYMKANGNRISGQISTTTKDYIINYQDMQGIGMTGNLALPTLIAICSAALGKTPLNSLAILGEISIGGTLIKVDELASTLQVCLDSGAKKVLLPITSAGDLGTVPSDLVGAFSLIFYSSAEEAVFKALGVE